MRGMLEGLFTLGSSLLIYAFFYGLALLGFAYVDRGYRKNKKSYIQFGAIWGIGTLCLFAALRADTVGTDVLVYAEPTFKWALTSRSFIDFLSNNMVTQTETIYSFLAYFVAHLFGEIKVFLFLIELIIVCPIYVCALKNRNRVPVFHTMAMFMLLYFPMGFNAMRQCMAASILLLAFAFFMEKKKVRPIVLTLVSVAFHSSAWIGILCFFVIVFVAQIRRKPLQLLVFASAFVLLSTLVYNLTNVMNWLIYDKGLLPSKYAFYISVFKGSTKGGEYLLETGTYGWIDLAFRVMNFILPLALLLHNNRRYDDRVRLYKYISFFSLICYATLFIIFHTIYGYRIVLYMDFIYIFYLGEVLHGRTGKSHTVYLSNAVMYVYLFIYYFMQYYLLGAHGVVPYLFA